MMLPTFSPTSFVNTKDNNILMEDNMKWGLNKHMTNEVCQ